MFPLKPGTQVSVRETQTKGGKEERGVRLVLTTFAGNMAPYSAAHDTLLDDCRGGNVYCLP